MSEEHDDANSDTGPDRVPSFQTDASRIAAAPPSEARRMPPMSTRECAELIGVSRFFVLDAIKAGELPAEAIRRKPGARPLYRVHEDDFLAWLTAIGWSRMPTRRTA